MSLLCEPLESDWMRSSTHKRDRKTESKKERGIARKRQKKRKEKKRVRI